MGDLNLDLNRRYDVDYCYKNLFDDFELHLETLNLLQLVNFDTWSRMVGTTLRSSRLDHIYVKNVGLIYDILLISPCFGDHKLIMMQMCIVRPTPRTSIRRSWYKYSPELLCAGLSVVDWSNTATDVQGVWNDFEYKLIMIIDELVPLTEFKNGSQFLLPCKVIKKKISLRKRLLKNFKRYPTLDMKHRIKSLNIEIKNISTLKKE